MRAGNEIGRGTRASDRPSELCWIKCYEHLDSLLLTKQVVVADPEFLTVVLYKSHCKLNFEFKCNIDITFSEIKNSHHVAFFLSYKIAL